MPASISSRLQAERIVAASRLALGLSSIFAIWVDPAESARWVDTVYTAQWAFVFYAAVIVAVVWLSRTPRFVLATQIIDLTAATVMQYVALRPSSALFIFYVFSMFCGAIRWGWRGALVTSLAVFALFIGTTLAAAAAVPLEHLEVNSVVVRVVYLVMAGGMLVYLGRHEARLREEIERLARWPAANTEQSIGQILEHAAKIVGAGRAVLLWEATEEPAVSVAVWTSGGAVSTTRRTDEIGPYLRNEAIGGTYALANAIARPRGAVALEEDVAAPDPGVGLASATFSTDRLSGRVIFGELNSASAEAASLTEVVAREIGASIDQMHVTQQLQEIAAREERLRLARDLHDGVLQSLTGIRLELRAVAQAVQTRDLSAQGRVLGIERALAIEQRELRQFIDGLKPTGPALAPAATLAERLEHLRERIALEWTTPVSIQIAPSLAPAATAVADAVPLMVHEAVTNALKHAGASAVSVEVAAEAQHLRVQVSDDGHGFGFKGRYDHATLRASAMAPRSLFERVSALGGEMSIESSDAGSRVEIVLALS